MADKKILFLSYFSRSIQDVKAFGASFQLNMMNKASYINIYTDLGYILAYTTKMLNDGGKYVTSFTKRLGNKDAFYHATLQYTDVGIGSEYFISKTGEEGRNLYNHLMETAEWPLLPEWGDALFKALKNKGCIRASKVTVKAKEGSPLLFDESFKDCVCVRVFNERVAQVLSEVISELITKGDISLTKEPIKQKPLNVDSLDMYYEKYGTSTVKNLESQMKPLTELSGDIDGVALKGMRLYPQQITMVNGIVSLVSGKKKAGKSRYCFINLGCGTGKTIISLAACEKYHVDKYLREHPGKSLQDVYSDPEAISYRAVIICPGHMVEKWKREAESQIPFAKATILSEFYQLTELRKRGQAKGKEILVMSKDFAKYTYSVQPVPYARTKGPVYEKICDGCGEVYSQPGDICPKCGHKGYHLHDKDRWGHKIKPQYTADGLKCPKCGKVLIPYKNISAKDVDCLAALNAASFDNRRTENSFCYWCNEPLWEPYVRNIEAPWWAKEDALSRHEPYWQRISVFANAKQTSTKSLWAHKKLQSGLIAQALNSRKDNDGLRKYSPAQYIKRYMKGCIDFLIADECHQYKNTSGQGEAFNALCQVAKRTLALTGTLTGGKADDLFYPLFRLDPARMKALGFKYTDSTNFSYRYGNVRKTKYYGDSEDTGSDYSSTTKGHSVRTNTKIEPGISPLIFTEFLLDRAVFLDLDDMSSHLPALNETVVSVSPSSMEEQEMYDEYRDTVDILNQKVKDDAREFGLMGDMLQFSLSWLDKPYTESRLAFISPYSGDAVAAYPQHPGFRDKAVLTTKEKKLIEIVKKELAEDRNVFIYLEYTNQIDTNCSDRLKCILEDALKERVEILHSSSPEAYKREEYIHTLAQEGVRVIITNPKCCETGVDFIFTAADGREYNYPTLIFYQMGYSLFTTQQASRRHYRLIQNRECRTYFMCWSGTAQEKVISIISRKMVAASAIQGHFSAEGLMSMAEGVDARVELARSLAEKDTESGAKLQDMFDVLKEGRETLKEDDSRWSPMKLLKEVVTDSIYEQYHKPREEKVFSLGDIISDEDEEVFDTGFDDIDLALL